MVTIPVGKAASEAGGKLPGIGTAIQVASTAYGLHENDKEIKAGEKNTADHADDLGLNVNEFASYSTTVKDYMGELSAKQATYLGKQGANIGVTAIAGGVGMALGGPIVAIPLSIGAGMFSGTDEIVDTIAGSKKNVALAMQSTAELSAAMQKGEEFTPSQVGDTLVAQLNQAELEQVKRAITNGGADPQNLASVYDALPTVMAKAEAIAGRPLEPGESATEVLADELKKGKLPPSILLVDNVNLTPDFISSVPDFSAKAPAAAEGIKNAGGAPAKEHAEHAEHEAEGAAGEDMAGAGDDGVSASEGDTPRPPAIPAKKRPNARTRR